MVGMTIASMIPVELNRISRSAAAMGPFGSSTPSEQPPSVAAPSKATARSAYRISSSYEGDDDGRRREHDRGRFAAAVDQKRREHHEEVEDRNPEKPVSSP